MSVAFCLAVGLGPYRFYHDSELTFASARKALQALGAKLSYSCSFLV